jgi:RNA polymerase sigma factor (sigma-70 family)
VTESTDTCWGAMTVPAQATASRLATRGLAEAIRAGDEEAFNLFYDRYADRTYRYLFSLLPQDEAVVCDAFQETMLRVVRYIKPMSDEVLWGWLTRVARTALYDQLRRSKRRAKREEAYGKEHPPEAWPDAEAADEHLLASLREAIDALDGQDREWVEAFYFRRETQGDIAKRFGMTRKAVASRMGRIRAALRERAKEILGRE